MMASVAVAKKDKVNRNVTETRTSGAQREALAVAADVEKKMANDLAKRQEEAKRPRKGKSDPETPPNEQKKKKSGDAEPAETAVEDSDSQLEDVTEGEAAGSTMAPIPTWRRRQEREEAMEERMELRMEAMMNRTMKTLFEQQRVDIKNDMDSRMESMEEIVKGVEHNVDQLRSRLDEEKEERLERQGQVRESIKELEEKIEMLTVGPGVKSWKEVVDDAGGDWQMVKGKGKGKAKGKEDEKEEEMSRTVVFNGYGEGVSAEDVIEHIKNEFIQEEDDDDIEDVYGFGRKYAQGGGVRFKSSRKMWDHLVNNKGKNWAMFRDRKIFARPGRADGEDVEKTKAVRKAVRAIYESEPGGIDFLKEETTANYKTGVVKFKGFMVAHWIQEAGDAKGELIWSSLPAAAKAHAGLMSA
jgi:hypothetical protein